jgi:MFS family permease
MGLDVASNATQLEGAINGLFQTGGLIGALACSWVSDTLGRRKAIFIACCICVVGGALQTGSVHVAMFITARLLTGLAIGKFEKRHVDITSFVGEPC